MGVTVHDAIHNPDSVWISTARAAKILDCSEAVVRRMIREGAIVSSMFYGRRLLLEESVKQARA